MPTVKTPQLLLQPHSDLIDQIRPMVETEARYWDALYMPLIERTATHLQELTNRTDDNQLLRLALNAAVMTLHRTADANFGLYPKRMRFACFAVALTYNCADPAADLEVTVSAADGKSTVWEPLEVSTVGELGHEYTGQWTYRRLDAGSIRPTIAWKLLPLTARQWLYTERGIVNELMKAASTPTAKLARYIPQHDITPSNPYPQLHEFTDYLQRLIVAGKFNQPTSRLHVVAEGLFLVRPGIFSDYDTLLANQIAAQLRVSPLLAPPADSAAKNAAWRFQTVTGQKLKGWIIDPARAGISAPKTLSKFLLQPIITSPSTS